MANPFDSTLELRACHLNTSRDLGPARLFLKTKREIGVDLHKADVARSKTLLYTTDYGHIVRAILNTALMFKTAAK